MCYTRICVVARATRGNAKNFSCQCAHKQHLPRYAFTKIRGRDASEDQLLTHQWMTAMMVPRAAGLWQRVRSALTGPHSECLAHRTGTCSLEQSPRRIAGGERAYGLPYCPPSRIVFFKPFHFKMMMMSPQLLGNAQMPFTGLGLVGLRPHGVHPSLAMKLARPEREPAGPFEPLLESFTWFGGKES